MALTAAQLKAVMLKIATDMNAAGTVRFTKPTLVAAASAADAWATSAAASYTTALATNAATFGTTATNQEKALLLAYVCLSRAGLL